MAHGWGIHLKESPDWPLFAAFMCIVLFLSGIIAGVYCWRTGDKQPRVAIGSWFTAVQAMGMTAVFLWKS
ncbi:hypothetical protein BDV96DRAFT_587864 [Lophiotrema nucula]|uniref:Uncharacterized protein n=1 Tax=Lophiotrema nucula TaxID=690887 RepID=A0A6A5YLM1_9PLEO|nr:hypothetical protein BDV96DRAFT_587864 [Lophiotrema nucula]